MATGTDRRWLTSAALAAACVVALAGCGAANSASASSPARLRAAIATYLREVEPIRLAVNRLLGRADPIIAAYHDDRATPAQAARRMGVLERRFAADTVAVAAIEPAAGQLRALHAFYAHTYVLEDAYLSALTVGLADRRFDALPDTQAAQRAAIIGWRTGLTVLARRAGVTLPPDLQQAGRGEIAPSPAGS